MKTVNIHETDLEACVSQAQRQRVVLTRKGKPVAVLIGIKGSDLKQVQLGQSDEFWGLIKERRAQKTIRRGELEQRLADK